jgi:hypothetical protein
MTMNRPTFADEIVQKMKRQGYGFLLEKFENWRCTFIEPQTKRLFEGTGETELEAIQRAAEYANAARVRTE